MSTPGEERKLLIQEGSEEILDEVPVKGRCIQILEKTKVLNPDSIVFRAIMLAFICGVTFGSYFVYDIPGSLQTYIIPRFGIQGSNLRYEALYSVYSWPNVFVVFIGGFLIDRVFGLRFGTLIFCMLVLIGQFIFSFGISIGGMFGYLVAILGRFIFGLGGESLAVAQNTFCAKWFRGKEFAMAFGITISFSRIGSAVNFNLEPTIGANFGLTIAVWLGFGFCLLSLASGIAAYFTDLGGEMTLKRADPARYRRELQVKADEPVQLTDVKHFPLSIWIIYLICITFYISVFVFIQQAATFFSFQYGISLRVAGTLTSIPYLESALFSPFLGFIVDKVGYAIFWMIISSAILLSAQLYFLLIPFHGIWVPIPALIAMGAAYSLLAAALWPSVAYIVDARRLGTAYGLMTALQNLGLALAPLLVGLVTSSGVQLANGMVLEASYWKGFAILAGFAFAALCLSILLLFVDFSAGRLINASAKAIRRRMNDVKENTIEVVSVEEYNEEVGHLERNHNFIRKAYLAKIGIAPDYIHTL